MSRRSAFVRADAEALQRAHDLRADRVAGIQRVERVLEDHLDRGDGALVAAASIDRPVLDRLVVEARRGPSLAGLEPEQHFGEASTCRSPNSPTIASTSASRAANDTSSTALTVRASRRRRRWRSRRRDSASSEPVDFEHASADPHRLDRLAFARPARDQSISSDPEAAALMAARPGTAMHRHVGAIADVRLRNARSAARNCSPSAARAAAATGRGIGISGLSFLLVPGSGHRAEQALRIGMAHRAEHVAHAAGLDRLARIHDGHANRRSRGSGRDCAR